jgi:hypothetical protein
MNVLLPSTGLNLGTYDDSISMQLIAYNPEGQPVKSPISSSGEPIRYPTPVSDNGQDTQSIPYVNLGTPRAGLNDYPIPDGMNVSANANSTNNANIFNLSKYMPYIIIGVVLIILLR